MRTLPPSLARAVPLPEQQPVPSPQSLETWNLWFLFLVVNEDQIFFCDFGMGMVFY